MPDAPDNPPLHAEQEAPEPTLRPEAERRIKDLFASGPRVPEQVDERILSMARARLSAPPDEGGFRRRDALASRPLRIGAAGLLAAAAIALAAALILQVGLPDGGPSFDDLAMESAQPATEGDALADLSRQALGQRADEAGLAEARKAGDDAPTSYRRSRSGEGAGAPGADPADAPAPAAAARSAPEPSLMTSSDERAEAEAQAWLPGPAARSFTMLDALRLSRALDGGEPVGDEWDLDSNGRIDRADVRLVARYAVSLSAGAEGGERR